MPVLTQVLLALMTAIYATMAVGLFGEAEPVLFGTFSRAIFTMFQVRPAHICTNVCVCVCVRECE